jgi:2-polyprenyl-3-methyl-5-hydroxy-6-metoxy-1,4-benzoquinol methylase
MDYSAHYSRLHPDTAEHDASLKAILKRWLGPHLPEDKASVVLDVGCGRGYALELLRDLGYSNLSGIEIDAGQVKFACSRNLAVICVEDSSDFLCGKKETYDLVLLMDVLEHITPSSHFAFLSAIRESLKPGGTLICTVPNAASPVASYFRHIDYTHQTAFTIDSLEFVLSQSGLHIGAVGGVEFFFRPRFLFWLPSQRTLQWLLLTTARGFSRFCYLAELGFVRGAKIILSPNLLAVARRP